MFRRILVPLDGSKRAEKAIPVAARIARASGGTIVFVEVVLPPVEFGSYPEDRIVKLKPGAFPRREEAEASYLTSITVTYADELAGINTELDLTSGAPSAEIYKAARLEAVDLIIFCSHGETGLKQWAFGSIAQEAVRHSPVPVLILNEHGKFPPEQPSYPLRVLVPLDGSALSESALLPVAYLVSALSGSLQNELHLFRVVDLPSAYGRMKSQAHISDLVHDEAVHEAEQYMKSVSERYTQDLAAFNLLVSSFVVDSAYVAGAILHESAPIRDAATTTGYDLIAMATHGRGGLLRRLMGSVTEQILGTTKLPMFVVRPQSAQVEIEGEVTGEAGLVEITEVEAQSQIEVV
ncbi:MAG TPA: universal stress protein [Ktedonobacteraceae bacterium]|nr:universal stress protein [Ktedonobacteraceae bacterium]